MTSLRTSIGSLALLGLVAFAACDVTRNDEPRIKPQLDDIGNKAAVEFVGSKQAHYDRVMTSAFCGECHTAIFAEHAQNTHGRAFTDEEVRLATGRFDHGDCIRCHTPRPIFETGIGKNPLRRFHDLEEGNTCMTCHWKQGVEYADFQGGADCKKAFDPRVGEVEACASCHRNHGTPYQWEIAPTGKLAGLVCMDCHMPTVERPIAKDGPVREGHAHVFPASRSASQLQRAYSYEAVVEGNEAVIRVTNKGAGHHFPTELKQRAVESLVMVIDAEGKEVARSRMVFRDPYKRPYGLNLPINTQILPGETREHRVPLKIANGSIRTELHYKLYYPIEDYHPELARLLESRSLLFENITPSEKAVESEPEVKVSTPDSVAPEIAGPANLVDFARPPIGKVEVEVPKGDDPESIKKLIELLQFPVPEANRMAVARLTQIGEKAIPALIEGMNSWDSKTFNQSMQALQNMGEKAIPAIVAALDRTGEDQLFVRYHSRALLVKLGYAGGDAKAEASTVAALGATNALDRTSAADLSGAAGMKAAIPSLRRLLSDYDADVVRSAALALAKLKDAAAIPELEAALVRTTFPETHRDLAKVLAILGDPSGIDTLLDGLDYPDDLVRESFFEAFFAVTGQHMGYEPLGPREERLEEAMRLRQWWEENSAHAAEKLRHPRKVVPLTNAAAWKLVEGLADPEAAAPPDEKTCETLRTMAGDAVPALVLGLKYPPGFAEKRRLICSLLAEVKDPDSVPALIYALRDPVMSVASWACFALGEIGDPESAPALKRYSDRVRSLVAKGAFPASAGSADVALAHAARARLMVGDNAAKSDLTQLLMSLDADSRQVAIDALEARYGGTRGYDPAAGPEERRRAAKEWEN